MRFRLRLVRLVPVLGIEPSLSDLKGRCYS